MEWTNDIDQAVWIRDSLDDFLEARVTSLVPRGFSSYVRILHPVVLGGENAPQTVTWRTVAAENGVSLDRGASFDHLLKSRSSGVQTGRLRPMDGTLYAPYARRAASVLSDYVSEGEYCWFAVWDGYGWIDSLGAADLPDSKLRLPYRDYLLFTGDVRDGVLLADRVGQTPNLWWPQSRTWFLATGIDMDSTYIGGPADLVERLLSDGDIETEPAVEGESRIIPGQ